MVALNTCVTLVSSIATKVGGSFADVLDQSKTGYDGGMQHYVESVYTQKIEEVVDSFIGYYLNPLIELYNHICVLAGVGGIGTILFFQTDTIEVKLGKCQAAITDIETGPAALTGQIPAPDDYLREYLQAQARVLYRRYLDCEAKAFGLIGILNQLNNSIPRTFNLMASPYGPDSLFSTIVFDGSIYTAGDSGRLYRWNGVDAWELLASPWLGIGNDIWQIIAHDGKIYARTEEHDVIVWNGDDAWENVHAMVPGFGIWALYSHSNGILYAICGSTDTRGLYALVDDAFVLIGSLTYKFTGREILEYGGKTYVCLNYGALWEIDVATGFKVQVADDIGDWLVGFTLVDGKLYVADPQLRIYYFDGTYGWKISGFITGGTGTVFLLYDSVNRHFYYGVKNIYRMNPEGGELYMLVSGVPYTVGVPDYLQTGVIYDGSLYIVTTTGKLLQTLLP